MIPPEEWRPVVGYEGAYEVSNRGQARSVERIVQRRHKSGGTATCLQVGRVLVHKMRLDGYPIVGLYGAPGSRQHFRIHVLVAAAFIGPRPEGLLIRHLDGNPQNNVVTNLAYGTPSENNLDQRLHGTNWNLNKTHCNRGHPLEPPNLSFRQGGRRRCLACHSAHEAVRKARRRGQVIDMQERSDLIFQRLIERHRIAA